MRILMVLFAFRHILIARFRNIYRNEVHRRNNESAGHRNISKLHNI